MKSKLIIVGAILGFLSISTYAKATEEKKEKPFQLRWVMAHKPEKFFVSTGNYFKKLVEKESKGQINVQIITKPLRGLDKDRIPHLRKDALEKIKNNEYEMTQIYSYALRQYASEMLVLDLPYLFDSNEHVASVLEGPIGKSLLKKINKGPIRALGFTYSGGFLVIPSRQKELHKVSDFKGLKYSPWPGSLSKKITEALGATYVEYNFSGNTSPSFKATSDFKFLDDLFKEQSVDIGDLSCGDVVEYISESDQIKVLNNLGYRVILTSLVMNKEFYNSLPQHLKDVVSKSAVEAARFEREMIISECDKIEGLAKSSSINLVSFQDVVGFKKTISNIQQEVLNSESRKELYGKIKQARKTLTRKTSN